MQGSFAKRFIPRKFIEYKINPRAGLILVVSLIGFIAWGWRINQTIQDQLKSEQQFIAQTILLSRANALTAAINRRLSLVDSVAAFINTHPRKSEIAEEFGHFAEGLYQAGSGIRAIEIFPDGINQFTYPLSRNQNELGHNLLTDDRPEVRRDVRRAMLTGKIAISGPYRLRQGGLGFVACKAINREGCFWGFAVIVMDLPALLKEAGLTTQELQFHILTGQGKQLWGSPNGSGQIIATQQIELPDGHWVMAVAANARLEHLYQRKLWLYRFLASLFAGMVYFIVILFITRHFSLKRLVEERTKALVETNRALAKDIEARIQTEKALSDSERRYRSLVEQASDGIFLMDEAGRHIDVNHMACRMLGYTRDELLGKTPQDLLTPQERIGNSNELAELSSGEIKYYERRLFRKDGSIILAESSAKRLDDGGYLAIVRDITENKKIEEIQNAFFTSTILGRLIVDRQGFLVRINPEMARITGLLSTDVSGKSTKELLPKMAPAIDYFCKRIFKFGDVAGDMEVCWELPGQPGVMSYWIASYFPIMGIDGQPLYVAVVFTDITQRKQIEEELKKVNAKLEKSVDERTFQLVAANKELESFSYSVSHDLGAPLRAIIGFSQALLEDYGDSLDPRAKDYLQRVHQGGLRMGLLIDDLLKLSRINRAELKRYPVDISALAGSVIEDLQANIGRCQVEFIIPQGLRAFADAGLMRIVLQNLLGNAFKFTMKVERARIELGSSVIDGNTVFFVRDNGAGFDMTYAKRLFTPFQRLHRAEEFEGTGIGLATVQRIINRHAGRIWAEGAVGEGATFYFTLGREQGRE